MIALFLLISFALEGIISNLVLENSVFVCLFSIVSLFVVYPLFNGEKTKYLAVAGIYGLIYDIVYTNCPFINTFAFLLTALIVIVVYNYLPINKVTFIFANIFIILFYQSISYLLLCIFDYTSFNDMTFFRGLYSCIISNSTFGVVSYLIFNLLVKKYKIKALK